MQGEHCRLLSRKHSISPTVYSISKWCTLIVSGKLAIAVVEYLCSGTATPWQTLFSSTLPSGMKALKSETAPLLLDSHPAVCLAVGVSGSTISVAHRSDASDNLGNSYMRGVLPFFIE